MTTLKDAITEFYHDFEKISNLGLDPETVIFDIGGRSSAKVLSMILNEAISLRAKGNRAFDPEEQIEKMEIKELKKVEKSTLKLQSGTYTSKIVEMVQSNPGHKICFYAIELAKQFGGEKGKWSNNAHQVLYRGLVRRDISGNIFPKEKLRRVG